MDKGRRFRFRNLVRRITHSSHCLFVNTLHSMKTNLYILSICCFTLLLSGCHSPAAYNFKASGKDTCWNAKNDTAKNGLGTSCSIDISKNTFNDTCIVHNQKIPPGKTGRVFYSRDYYSQSIQICLKKYKASAGHLIVKCSFEF